MQMLGGGPKQQDDAPAPQRQAAQGKAPASKPAPSFDDMDDDIPW